MGQKANPIGNRLGIIRGWESNWYGNKKDYATKLIEDQKIRKYLNARINKGGIARIVIERTLGKLIVTIHTSKPGIIIGKGGGEVDRIKEELKKLTGKDDVQINILEIRRPELDATIVGETIGQKIRNLSKADWGYNTDLISVFKSILQAAKADNVAPSDMPEKIFIVSDMQFDEACKSNKRTNFEQIKKNYAKFGYNVPQLVFWNVNGAANVPMTVHDSGTCLVSGCSPSILKAVLNSEIISPRDLMLDAVYTERYDLVSQALKKA